MGKVVDMAARAMMDAERGAERRQSNRSLTRLHKMHDAQNDYLEEHEREPRRARITESTVHHDEVTRLDARFDWEALGKTKEKLPRREYLCFIAMEFGLVEDAKSILRWHPGKRELIERDLSFAEVAKHYGLAESTVQEYDRGARKVYADAFADIQYQRRRMGQLVEE
jgi:hypothetical protein